MRELENTIETSPLVKIAAQNKILPTPIEDAFLFRQFLNDFQAEEPQVKNEQEDNKQEKQLEELSKESTIEPVITEAIYALIRPKTPVITLDVSCEEKSESIQTPNRIPREMKEVAETQKDQPDSKKEKLVDHSFKPTINGEEVQDESEIPKTSIDVLTLGESESANQAISTNRPLQELNQLNREISDLMRIHIEKTPVQEMPTVIPVKDQVQSKSISSDLEKKLSEPENAGQVIAKDWSVQTAVPKKLDTFEIKVHEPNQLSREISDLITVTVKKMPLEKTSTASVHVKLSPEKLGDLEIELTWRGDQVEAKIIVSKPEMKQQLVDQLAIIHEQLPKNPIVQVIMIEVKPPIDLSQQSYPRKQTQSPPKNRHTSNGRGEEETEISDNLALLGLSLYV